MSDQIAAEAATPDQPVRQSERLVSLDFIRGIAVMGILFANIVFFGQPMLAYFWPGGFPDATTALDNVIWLLQFVFIDGKMRGLFTILFGAGLVLFMDRAWARGATGWLQVRRLIWLLLFGLAHFILLFRGDILFGYALVGLFALMCINWQAKTQVAFGLILYCVFGVIFTALIAFPMLLEQVPEMRSMEGMQDQWPELESDLAGQISETNAQRALFDSASYAGIVADTVKNHLSMLGKALLFGPMETWPLMLVGMGLYRKGLFDGRMDQAKLKKWGWIGFIAGTVLTLPLGIWAWSEGFPYWLTLFVFNGPMTLTRLPMVLGMLALMAYYAPRLASGQLGQRVIAAGRMAFSNYLGTSFVMLFVFQSWGLALHGELGRTGLLVVVLAAWALMLAWSKPWLARFRYGPLEWLWRCLTYWKLFPLKR